MTAQPLPSVAPQPINWTMVSVLIVVAIQLAGVVSFGAQVRADIGSLKQTTEPLRQGDLVAVERDVAWIRAQMEKDAGR